MPANKARKLARQRQREAAEAQEARYGLDGAQEPQAEENQDVKITEETAEATANSDSKPSRTKSKPESITKPRFIVFVGKLPYTATTETIKQHFAKLAPSSIRHMTKKGTNESKGCAFLEFERYDQMKECLKQYHHSLFDDGRGGEKRKINIELTVGGGGGKSKDRKAKLRAKNDKLAEERHRRATQRKDGGKGAGSKPKQQEGDDSQPAPQDHSGIHPSRLAQMKR